MKVLYYTSPSFLDISVEMILVLKKQADLHVLIEISPGSKNRNIINIDKLPEGKTFYSPKELLDEETYHKLKPYFEGCSSVNFVVHNQKKALSSIKVSYQLLKYIKEVKPDILQMEAVMIRSLGLIPALFRFRKIILTIHDPVVHKGEGNWRLKIINTLFFKFPVPKVFLFYSDFAKNQFIEHHQKNSNPKYVIRMRPYSYFQSYEGDVEKSSGYILFIGRLSVYKGVDVLLEAMLSVFKEYPEEKLIIAGRSINGYQPDESVLHKYKENARILNRYIPNDELVALVRGAKFIVCPYIEATQSGVLMTAFALNTPVIASDTGAFSEYIIDHITGRLVKADDVSSLAKGIIAVLKDNSYEKLKINIEKRNELDLWGAHQSFIPEVYC